MRRADRLFEIIQILRRASGPLTADAIAAELETSKRTVYRDIGALIAQRVPIRGEVQRAMLGAARSAAGIPLDYARALTAIHPDDRERVRKAVQRALDPAGDGVYAVEYRTVGLHSGVMRWIVARGRAFFSAGRGVRFLGTTVDITERAELMAREQKARAAAEEANRLKDEFLATISHELRTPLTAIMGWASILGRNQPSAAKLAKGIDVIHRSAKAQTALIEDILDVSRIITGNLRIEQELVDLDAVVKDALDAVMPSAAAKDIDAAVKAAAERAKARW